MHLKILISSPTFNYSYWYPHNLISFLVDDSVGVIFKLKYFSSPGELPGGVPRGSRGGSRELFGLPIWRKKSKDKTLGVFFHAAFDFDTPGPWNTAQKSKVRKVTSLQNIDFSYFDQIMIWGYGSAWFFTLIPKPTSKPAQTKLKSWFYQKSYFYMIQTLIAPTGPRRRARGHIYNFFKVKILKWTSFLAFGLRSGVQQYLFL